MSATAADPVTRGPGWASSLWNRQLDSYPDTGRRIMYLAITVLATITLYYELYVGASVTTLILPKLGMTFSFYVTTLAFGNLLGAFGSLFAGPSDPENPASRSFTTEDATATISRARARRCAG